MFIPIIIATLLLLITISITLTTSPTPCVSAAATLFVAPSSFSASPLELTKQRSNINEDHYHSRFRSSSRSASTKSSTSHKTNNIDDDNNNPFTNYRFYSSWTNDDGNSKKKSNNNDPSSFSSSSSLSLFPPFPEWAKPEDYGFDSYNEVEKFVFRLVCGEVKIMKMTMTKTKNNNEKDLESFCSSSSASLISPSWIEQKLSGQSNFTRSSFLFRSTLINKRKKNKKNSDRDKTTLSPNEEHVLRKVLLDLIYRRNLQVPWAVSSSVSLKSVNNNNTKHNIHNNDNMNNCGSALRPCSSIQEALLRAAPHSTIVLLPGVYNNDDQEDDENFRNKNNIKINIPVKIEGRTDFFDEYLRLTDSSSSTVPTAADVVLDCSSSSSSKSTSAQPCLKFENVFANVENIRFQGGLKKRSSSQHQQQHQGGGCVEIVRSSQDHYGESNRFYKCTFDQCINTNNKNNNIDNQNQLEQHPQHQTLLGGAVTISYTSNFPLGGRTFEVSRSSFESNTGLIDIVDSRSDDYNNNNRYHVAGAIIASTSHIGQSRNEKEEQTLDGDNDAHHHLHTSSRFEKFIQTKRTSSYSSSSSKSHITNFEEFNDDESDLHTFCDAYIFDGPFERELSLSLLPLQGVFWRHKVIYDNEYDEGYNNNKNNNQQKQKQNRAPPPTDRDARAKYAYSTVVPHRYRKYFRNVRAKYQTRNPHPHFHRHSQQGRDPHLSMLWCEENQNWALTEMLLPDSADYFNKKPNFMFFIHNAPMMSETRNETRRKRNSNDEVLHPCRCLNNPCSSSSSSSSSSSLSSRTIVSPSLFESAGPEMIYSPNQLPPHHFSAWSHNSPFVKDIFVTPRCVTREFLLSQYWGEDEEERKKYEEAIIPSSSSSSSSSRQQQQQGSNPSSTSTKSKSSSFFYHDPQITTAPSDPATTCDRFIFNGVPQAQDQRVRIFVKHKTWRRFGRPVFVSAEYDQSNVAAQVDNADVPPQFLWFCGPQSEWIVGSENETLLSLEPDSKNVENILTERLLLAAKKKSTSSSSSSKVDKNNIHELFTPEEIEAERRNVYLDEQARLENMMTVGCERGIASSQTNALHPLHVPVGTWQFWGTSEWQNPPLPARQISLTCLPTAFSKRDQKASSSSNLKKPTSKTVSNVDDLFHHYCKTIQLFNALPSISSSSDTLISGPFMRLPDFEWAARPVYIHISSVPFSSSSSSSVSSSPYFVWYCMSLAEWIVVDTDPRLLDPKHGDHDRCFRAISSSTTFALSPVSGVMKWALFLGERHNNEWVAAAEGTGFKCVDSCMNFVLWFKDLPSLGDEQEKEIENKMKKQKRKQRSKTEKEGEFETTATKDKDNNNNNKASGLPFLSVLERQYEVFGEPEQKIFISSSSSSASTTIVLFYDEKAVRRDSDRYIGAWIFAEKISVPTTTGNNETRLIRRFLGVRGSLAPPPASKNENSENTKQKKTSSSSSSSRSSSTRSGLRRDKSSSSSSSSSQQQQQQQKSDEELLLMKQYETQQQDLKLHPFFITHFHPINSDSNVVQFSPLVYRPSWQCASEMNTCRDVSVQVEKPKIERKKLKLKNKKNKKNNMEEVSTSKSDQQQDQHEALMSIDGVYRESMLVNGRPVYVRQQETTEIEEEDADDEKTKNNKNKRNSTSSTTTTGSGNRRKKRMKSLAEKQQQQQQQQEQKQNNDDDDDDEKQENRNTRRSTSSHHHRPTSAIFYNAEKKKWVVSSYSSLLQSLIKKKSNTSYPNEDNQDSSSKTKQKQEDEEKGNPGVFTLHSARTLSFSPTSDVLWDKLLPSTASKSTSTLNVIIRCVDPIQDGPLHAFDPYGRPRGKDISDNFTQCTFSGNRAEYHYHQNQKDLSSSSTTSNSVVVGGAIAISTVFGTTRSNNAIRSGKRGTSSSFPSFSFYGDERFVGIRRSNLTKNEALFISSSNYDDYDEGGDQHQSRELASIPKHDSHHPLSREHLRETKYVQSFGSRRNNNKNQNKRRTIDDSSSLASGAILVISSTIVPTSSHESSSKNNDDDEYHLLFDHLHQQQRTLQFFMLDSVVAENSAQSKGPLSGGAGGALSFVNLFSSYIKGSSLLANSAVSSSGGAIRLHRTNNLTLELTHCGKNFAALRGGCIFTSDLDTTRILVSSQSEIFLNKAGQDASGDGTAIFAPFSGLTVVDSKFDRVLGASAIAAVQMSVSSSLPPPPLDLPPHLQGEYSSRLNREEFNCLFANPQQHHQNYQHRYGSSSLTNMQHRISPGTMYKGFGCINVDHYNHHRDRYLQNHDGNDMFSSEDESTTTNNHHQHEYRRRLLALRNHSPYLSILHDDEENRGKSNQQQDQIDNNNNNNNNDINAFDDIHEQKQQQRERVFLWWLPFDFLNEEVASDMNDERTSNNNNDLASSSSLFAFFIKYAAHTMHDVAGVILFIAFCVSVYEYFFVTTPTAANHNNNNQQENTALPPGVGYQQDDQRRLYLVSSDEEQ